MFMVDFYYIYRCSGTPSEIPESCVANTIVDHTVTENQLITRHVVGVAYLPRYRLNGFDSNSHDVLEHNLEHKFGIKGNLLAWIKLHLQAKAVWRWSMEKRSEKTVYEIPQGLVPTDTLRPIYKRSPGSSGFLTPIHVCRRYHDLLLSWYRH